MFTRKAKTTTIDYGKKQEIAFDFFLFAWLGTERGERGEEDRRADIVFVIHGRVDTQAFSGIDLRGRAYSCDDHL